MTIEDCYKIGYVSKTHGLKGEVTAIIETDVDWSDLKSLFIDLNGSLVPHTVEKISGTAGKPFIKLESIQSIEKASLLKGCSLYILKSVRPKLKRGEFYDDEIVGFLVQDKDLGIIGQVKGIQSQGANRLLAIIHGPKEILIPINAPFITSLSKTKKIIRVELPDGFLDL